MRRGTDPLASRGRWPRRGTAAVRIAAALLGALLLSGCINERYVYSDVVVVSPDLRTPPPPFGLEEAVFYIAPFRSIPGNAADTLSRFLVSAGRREGITLVRREERRHNLVLTGHLSAVSDDTNGTVFYVFDLETPDGEVLYRVRGRQTTGRSRGDPWASVRPSDLRFVADVAAARIRAWLLSGTPPQPRGS